LKASVPLPETV